MERQEMEKKMKAYAKHARRAGKGSRRSKKKLRKMVQNDLISVIAKKATNHPAWYTKLGGELIGLNFGSIDQLTPRADLIKGYQSEQITVRTTVDVIIYTAITATDDDTIRVAAQKIVNELRLVSGANTIYDVDDMVDYMLNIRSIWVALTETRRAIRCLNASDPYDIDAWRKYLMMALNDVRDQGPPVGFTSEFREKAASIVNWLNTITKSVRFMMPGNFALFERTSWMFTNIFVDGTGVKFGSKMFVAKEVPYYTHSGTVHTGTTKKLFAPDQTVSALLGAIEDMVTDFTTKVENVAIAGDLMKAYGMKAFYDPGEIMYTEKPAFVFDERALEQIANCDIALDARSVGSYQYDGTNSPLVLTYSGNPITKTEFSSRFATFETKFVNTEDNEVEPGETLSLTRLKCTAVPEYNAANELLTVAVRDCGTEVVVDYVYMVGIANVGGFDVLAPQGATLPLRAQIDTFVPWASFWSMDDYGPMTMCYEPGNWTPGTGAPWTGDIVFDFANWALMSRVEQRQLHKTAVLSLMTPTASVVQQAVARL